MSKTKYCHGTIVNSLIKPNCKLINLYELFMDYPDSNVDITNYINYCEKFYDYTMIFNSKLMRENNELAQALAFQILISILKLDQNYHYENILFYDDNTTFTLAPMIDHEFSSMFLYLDRLDLHQDHFEKGISSLIPNIDSDNIFNKYQYQAFATLYNNLDLIVSRYPNTAYQFLVKLKHFISDWQSESFMLRDNNYIQPFNSFNFIIYQAQFKHKNIELANKLDNNLVLYNPKIDDISKLIYEEVISISNNLFQEIEKRLVMHN